MNSSSTTQAELASEQGPVFVPFYERQNMRADGTGLIDHSTVLRDGKPVEITNFEVIQEAFRACVPPRKVYVGAAWSDEAKQENNELREKRESGEITAQDVYKGFVVGVYIQDITTT